MSIDHVLKLYSKTIQSSYLHYGFWDDPNSIKIESINLEEIKNAQGRYIEHLASYIPNDVKLILDVGCGIGGNAEFLAKKGYDLETLSPDDFQRSVINEKFNGKIPFHHCKFEKFQPEKKYDLIVELEESIQSLAVRKSAIATRSNLTVTAKYVLVSAVNPQTLLSSSEQATVSYNIYNSKFATLVAHRNAHERAIRSLSKDIVISLAIYFERQKNLSPKHEN